MDITKLLLIGGIGYIAYEYFLAPASAAPGATAPASSGGIQPGPTPPVASTAPAVNANTTFGMVQAKAQAAGFTQGNVDQWNYYYAQARGIPAPAPEDWGFTPDNRGEILTLAEWWQIAQAHGLSGVVRAGSSMARPGLGGMGWGYIPSLVIMDNQ